MSGKQNGNGRRIAWWDIESTGLGGADAGILCLEAALAVTDQDLNVLAREHVVLRHEAAVLSRCRWDDEARRMHEANGLIREVQEPGAVVQWVAEERLVAALARGCDLSVAELEAMGHPEGSFDARSPLWGGCSPHLDRSVVRRCLPRAYRIVHYRTIDATGLRIALELWHGLKIGEKTGPKPHRAVEDVDRAIEIAREYRRLLHLADPSAPLVRDELERASA